jgi:hypothetical protein
MKFPGIKPVDLLMSQHARLKFHAQAFERRKKEIMSGGMVAFGSHEKLLWI